jgi:hypothetical protein
VREKRNAKISSMKMHNNAKPLSSQHNKIVEDAVFQKVKYTFNVKYVTTIKSNFDKFIFYRIHNQGSSIVTASF